MDTRLLKLEEVILVRIFNVQGTDQMNLQFFEKKLVSNEFNYTGTLLTFNAS